jgi:acetyltransferase
MNLTPLFHPNSIALIGASNTPGKLGNYLAKNLVESNYGGTLYFLNPKKEQILGINCLQSPLEITENIDLWVVAIPANLVLDVVEQIIVSKNKINNTGETFLVVISAGFREISEVGKRLEQELLKLCQKNNIKIIGPNCLGIINNTLDSKFNYNASFAVQPKISGGVSFISQSGAIISGIVDQCQSCGIGFNKIISTGNQLDLDTTDLLEFLITDPQTKVIAIYVEGFNHGKKFVELAKKSSKPIIILKSGNSSIASKAISSHTGSIAGNSQVTRSYLKDAGCILAESLDEFFDNIIFFSRWR